MSTRPWVMAIDFGTSFTVAAGLAEGGSAEIIEINGERRTPSVILVEGPGRFVVGQVAEDLSTANPQAVLRAPKNRLGDQAPAVVAGRPYQVAELVAALLAQVYKDGVRQFGGPPREVRLTHPATWNRPRLARLAEAAAKAGISDPVLVPEPVAAALAYWQRDDLPEGGHVAVYDLGGGTFDTAVVRLRGDAFQVVGRAGGDSTVGGELFDELLANAIGERFEPAAWEALQLGEDLGWRRAAAALRTESRKAKETLSSHPYADLVLPLPTGTVQHRVLLEEFEELIAPYVDETVLLLGRCIADAGLTPSDLAAIQLVGGASRIPLVQRAVQEAFPAQVVHRRGDPKTTVALGALLASAASTTAFGAMGRGSTEDGQERTAPISEPEAPVAAPTPTRPVPPPPAAPPPPRAPAVVPVPSVPPPSGRAAQTPAAPSGPTTPPPTTPIPTGSGARPASRKRGPLIAAAAIVGVLAIGGGVLLVTRGGDDESSGGSGGTDKVTNTTRDTTATTDTLGTEPTTTAQAVEPSTTTETESSTTVAEETTVPLGPGPTPKPEGLVGFETMKGASPPAPTYGDFDSRLAGTSYSSALTDTGYGAETYDAFVVAALAAQVAGTDGLEFADEIVRVVQDGTACTTYGDCKKLLADGFDIDYDGVSGLLPMNGLGDTLVSSFNVFEFGADQRLDPARTSSWVGVDLPRSGLTGPPASGDRPGDGVFTVGALVPNTGDLSAYGPAVNAALELAVADVNIAGGVLDQEVVLVVRDSGDSSTDLVHDSADDLIAAGVDVVIGPLSSDGVYSVIDQLTGAGIAIISPGAGSDALSDYPDSGLFFRTAPADSMQASVIGDLLVQDGNRNYVIVARDDEYGAAIAGALTTYMEAFDPVLLADERFAPGTVMADYLGQAQQIADLAPDAVVFIGYYEDGGVLQALADRGVSATVQNFYVNDAVLFDDFGLTYGLIGGE